MDLHDDDDVVSVPDVPPHAEDRPGKAIYHTAPPKPVAVRPPEDGLPKSILPRRARPQKIDPTIRALTRARIDDEIREYIALLDANVDESKVQRFLAEHSYFFNDIMRMYSISPLYSKPRLGAEYEADFAFFDTSSYGPEWNFVEIEAPSRKLFTRALQPSSWLTHAVQQIQDWAAWFHDNLAYAARSFPAIEYPYFYIFMGRRRDLTDETRKRLKRFNFDHRALLEVHTLDAFADHAASVKNLIGADGGTWSVPAKAFTQEQLADKRPRSAFQWLASKREHQRKVYYSAFALEERMASDGQTE